MGTNIFLLGKPMAPCNISAIKAEIWGQMKLQRTVPDAAMMVLKAKIPLKLFTTASIYRPTATAQHTNDAMMMRCWKQILGTSRHALGALEKRLSGAPPLGALVACGGGL